ncbi:adenylate/guanylate cyclase domain-containing protein [Moraxella lincolnii]|uniref:adenylate/guanylate cyclase domain-containing protein n=1 Tax=Lwoffella lincolnii TaxID=90241 RepID=UPI003983EBF0
MPTERSYTYPHVEFIPILVSALLLVLWGQLDMSYHHADNIHLLTWLFVALMAAVGMMGWYSNRANQHQPLTNDGLDALSLFTLGSLILSTGLYSLVNLLYVAMMLIRLIKIQPSTRLVKLLVALLPLLTAYALFTQVHNPVYDVYFPMLPDVMQAALLALGLMGMVADGYYLLHDANRLDKQSSKMGINHTTDNNTVLNERIKELGLVINSLTRYVPCQLHSSIIREHHTPIIYNKRTELTLMFADIVGFAQLSESLSAEHLANVLNTYMAAMTRINIQHGALLDKFIGDGMVCFFGYPKSNDVRGDAVACVAMALDMQQQMHLLSNQWQMMGIDDVHIRIGINTGCCHVGNYGSKDRMSFTVIGREVNFAARLEAAAQPKEILISQSTYDLVKHKFHCQKAGSLKIAGFQDTLPCYRVMANPQEIQKSEGGGGHAQNTYVI